MRVRWHFLLPVATFAIGYLFARQTAGPDTGPERSARAPREPAGHGYGPAPDNEPGPEPENTHEDEHERASAPTARTTAAPPDGTPPHRRPARAMVLPGEEWGDDRFVHWYRAHAAAYGFEGRMPEELRSFYATVIRQLGRIPRREILDALLEIHDAYARARAEVAADLAAGRIARAEVESRIAPARRRYSEELYGRLPFSDYLYLTREWSDHASPYRPFRIEQPPKTARPAGDDPYEIRIADADRFVMWYRAYRYDLELPERDDRFLRGFHDDLVLPLGRVPRAPLMRTLQDLYAIYHEKTAGDGAYDRKAAPELFEGLRTALTPLDFDRIRWWGNWIEILRGGD